MKIIFSIFVFLQILFSDLLVYDKVHSAPVTNLSYCNGNIISVSRDGTIRVWDKNLKLKKIIFAKRDIGFGNFYALATNKDYIIASGLLYQPIPIYIFDEKTLNHVKTITQNSNTINSIAISSNNTKFIVATSDPSLYIYSLKTLKTIKEIFLYKLLPNHHIYDVKFLDNKTVVFVTRSEEGGSVVIYDIKQEKIIKKIDLDFHLWCVDVVIMSPEKTTKPT